MREAFRRWRYAHPALVLILPAMAVLIPLMWITRDHPAYLPLLFLFNILGIFRFPMLSLILRRRLRSQYPRRWLRVEFGFRLSKRGKRIGLGVLGLGDSEIRFLRPSGGSFSVVANEIESADLPCLEIQGGVRTLRIRTLDEREFFFAVRDLDLWQGSIRSWIGQPDPRKGLPGDQSWRERLAT